MAQLFNAILIATGERLQVYQEEKTSGYKSPKYPGRVFKYEELTIVGEA